ncbi:MAG: Spy/CpxP family protein refolding chaperone [Flavobacterium sp.]
MKKLFVIAFLAMSMVGFAQKKEGKMNAERAEMEQLTPEQRTELMVKRLDLELDLTDEQKKQITTYFQSKEAKRAEKVAAFKAKKAEGKKLTADERLAMRDEMLNQQIANKEQMKKILTPAQFEKWEQMKENKQNQRLAKKGKGKQ